MKKSDLAHCLHQDIENWEIVNIGHDNISNRVELLLMNFEWKGVLYGRDYKEYTNKFKKIILLDENAFLYYEDGVLFNSIQEYIKLKNGLNFYRIKEIVLNPENIYTTPIQSGWKNILVNLNIFNKESYKIKFIEELKKYFAEYLNENPNEEMLEIFKFIEELMSNLKNENSSL